MLSLNLNDQQAREFLRTDEAECQGSPENWDVTNQGQGKHKSEFTNYCPTR
jgi:hypothetical protein